MADSERRARIVIHGEDRSGSAFKSAAANARGLQRQIDGVAAAFTGAGATIGAAIGGFGVGTFVKNAIDGIDALNDLADATGSTVGNISALEDVARRGGSSIEDVSTAVLRLNKQLSDAKPGSDVERTLQAIGLSAKDLKQLDPAEALRQVAVAMAGYADDGGKARLMQDLFGKSTKEVAKFLKDLAEVGTLNATVTEEQARQAKAFNDQLDQMSKSATDAGRAVGGTLASAVNQLLDAVNGAGIGTLNQALAVPLQAVSVLGANVAFVIRGIGIEIGGLAAQAAAVARLDFKGAATIGEAMRADAQAAREEFDRLEQRLLSIGTATQADYSNEGRRSGRKKPGLPDRGEVNKEASTFLESLRRQLVATQDLTTAEQVLQEIRSGHLKGADKAVQGQALQIAREIDLTKEAIRVARERADFRNADAKAARDAAIENERAERDRLNSLLADTPGARTKRRDNNIDFLAEAAKAGKIPLSSFGEALDALTPKLDSLKDASDEVSDFAQEAGRNIQDALGDTVLATLDGKFSSIGRLWGNMLKRMAAEAIAANLARKLIGDSFSKTGDVGGLLGQLVAMFKPGGTPYGSGQTGQNIGYPLAKGMDYVPYDGYPAVLHRGERVMTADENRASRASGHAGTTIVVQGDVGDKALRAMRTALAQLQAQQAYQARFA